MAAKSVTCPEHERLMELICKTCGAYLCPECVTTHNSSGHEPLYVHALAHSAKQISSLDSVMVAIAENSGQIEAEAQEIIPQLQALNPIFDSVVGSYAKNVDRIKGLQSKLKVLSTTNANYPQRIQENLLQLKAQLVKGLATKNYGEVAKICGIVEKEREILETEPKPLAFGGALESLSKDLILHNDLISAARKLTSKLGLLGIYAYYGEWQLAKKYCSSTAILSEDGLTFESKDSSGQVAIIGDTPISEGLMAFEVTPIKFSRVGREGFGIIDRELFMATGSGLKVPLHEAMLGFLYKPDETGAQGVRKTGMHLNEKYQVHVNMMDYSLRIQGKDLDIKIDLHVGTEYVPFILCAASGSKISVQPLESYGEVVYEKIEIPVKKEVEQAGIIPAPIVS